MLLGTVAKESIGITFPDHIECVNGSRLYLVAITVLCSVVLLLVGTTINVLETVFSAPRRRTRLRRAHEQSNKLLRNRKYLWRWSREASAELRRVTLLGIQSYVAQVGVLEDVAGRPVSRRQAQRAKGPEAQSRVNEAMVNFSTSGMWTFSRPRKCEPWASLICSSCRRGTDEVRQSGLLTSGAGMFHLHTSPPHITIAGCV